MLDDLLAAVYAVLVLSVLIGDRRSIRCSNLKLSTSRTAVLDACRARGWHVATAESCTGGLVAAALTAIAGSSDVVERGFVTYSNEAKSELLGVPPATIAAHGAVSAETAAAMAEGAVARAPVDLAVSITGVAGPGGGSAEKPVGLVYFGVARRGRSCPHRAPHLPRRPRRGARRGLADGARTPRAQREARTNKRDSSHELASTLR